jgi:hypothetical protein
MDNRVRGGGLAAGFGFVMLLLRSKGGMTYGR